MTTVLNDLAMPRKPQQERSRERFEHIVQAGEALLLECGLSGFSIPVIAERLGYNRRSIYMFFPTPYALLNEMTRRYIEKMEKHILSAVVTLVQEPVANLLTKVTYAAADFHNDNPVGRLLILGGAVTDRSYRAQELNIKRLGDLSRELLQSKGIQVPLAPPDITAVAVELGTACFRLSHARHNSILDTYKVEAVYTMLRYLSDLLPQGSQLSREQLQALL